MKKKISNTVEKALKKAEIHYMKDDNSIFRFGLKHDHASYDVGLACVEDMELLMILVSCSICVPQVKIERMCRWIVDKNYTLNLGEFKLDTSDGELTFRISCPLDNGAVNEDIVNVIIANALNTFEMSYEDIMKELYTDMGGQEEWALRLAQEAAKQIKDAQESQEETNTKRINS